MKIYLLALLFLVVSMTVSESYTGIRDKNLDGIVSYSRDCKYFSDEYGIPVELVYTIQVRETGHLDPYSRAKAISPKGAIGLMQIMPSLGKLFKCTKKDLLNPRTNIKVCCAHLKYLWVKHKGDIGNILAEYNGGVRQASKPNYLRCKETRNYVINGLKTYHYFRRLK